MVSFPSSLESSKRGGTGGVRVGDGVIDPRRYGGVRTEEDEEPIYRSLSAHSMVCGSQLKPTSRQVSLPSCIL